MDKDPASVDPTFENFQIADLRGDMETMAEIYTIVGPATGDAWYRKLEELEWMWK